MQTAEQLKVEKKFEQETKDFRLLVEKYPLSIISSLALYFNSKGKPEKATNLLVSALEKWPEEPELCDQLVFLANKAGKPKEAEKKLLEAQTFFPENPLFCGSLGRHYFLEKNFTQAKDFLEKSIKLNPEDGVNHLFLALSRLKILCEQKGVNISELPELLQIDKEIQKSKELNPEIVTDDFLKGKELLAQNNYTEAFKYLGKSLNGYLNKKMEFTRFHQLFFSFYMEPEKFDLEDLKKYIQELEKKLSLSLSSEKELNYLGCCYILFFINLVKSSEEQLEKALVLDPEFEGAKEALRFLEKMKSEMLPLIDSLRF